MPEHGSMKPAKQTIMAWAIAEMAPPTNLLTTLGMSTSPMTAQNSYMYSTA